MKLTLIGSRYNDALIQHTKKALSDTLSPVQKNSIARSFLTRFLGVQNEHQLNDVIKESAQDESKPQQANLVSLKEYEFSEQGGAHTLFSTTSVVCLSEETTNSAMKEFFRSGFPDHDGVTGTVVESSLVQYHLDEKFECPFGASDELEKELAEQRESLEQELHEMESTALMDWLLDNIAVESLTDDSFFSDLLNSGLYNITVDPVDIK